MTTKNLPDRSNSTSFVVANGGSNNINVQTVANGIMWLVGHVVMLPYTGGVAKAAHMVAECVVVSDGTAAGTRFPTALTGGLNPQSAANLGPAGAEACEFNAVGGGNSTLFWQIAAGTTIAQLLVTDNDPSAWANFLMWVEIYTWVP